MPTSPTDIILAAFTRQLLESAESIVARLRVSPLRPIDRFAREKAPNVFFVLYSPNGVPMHVGVRTASMKKRMLAQFERDLASLAASGAVAGYKVIETGSEELAEQLGRLFGELFRPVLPLAAERRRRGK